MAVFGFGTVLTIVIFELAFAFGVGLSCIVMSYNLFRALSSERDANDCHGESTPLQNLTTSEQNPREYSQSFDSVDEIRLNASFMSSDSELDYEEQVDDPTLIFEGENGNAIFRVFTNYLRWW
jgi:hypothetical protein